jgi:hypothetical protein
MEEVERRGEGSVRSAWPKFILPTFLPARARGSILLSRLDVLIGIGDGLVVSVIESENHWAREVVLDGR